MHAFTALSACTSPQLTSQDLRRIHRALCQPRDVVRLRPRFLDVILFTLSNFSEFTDYYSRLPRCTTPIPVIDLYQEPVRVRHGDVDDFRVRILSRFIQARV